MPYFVIPGLLAVIIGFVFIGILILRSGVLPLSLGVVLVVSSVALLAAKEQTWAVADGAVRGHAVNIVVRRDDAGRLPDGPQMRRPRIWIADPV